MILLGNVILCIYFDKNLRTTPEPLFSSKEGIKMTKKNKANFPQEELCLVKWTQSQKLSRMSFWSEDIKFRFSLNSGSFKVAEGDWWHVKRTGLQLCSCIHFTWFKVSKESTVSNITEEGTVGTEFNRVEEPETSIKFLFWPLCLTH